MSTSLESSSKGYVTDHLLEGCRYAMSIVNTDENIGHQILGHDAPC